MKLLSSSIIVLAGALMIAGSSLFPESDTRQIVGLGGSVVGLIGLGGWFVAFRGNRG